MLRSRLLLAAGTLSWVAAWSGVAYSQEAKRECVDAYEQAQLLEREGSLLEAREKLIYCSGADCPHVMHADCQRWLSEVEAATPTVVFQVETASGTPADPSSVSIDGGESVAVDGRAISVNPGRHRVTFSSKGLQSTTVVLLFVEGEKLRREVVMLEPVPKTGGVTQERESAPEAAAPRARRRITTPIVLSSSLAVAGGGAFAYFGLKARAEDHDLDDCTPNCTGTKVENVKRNYLLANVSLGMGVAGLLTTTALLVLRPPRHSTRSRIRLGPHGSAHGVSLSGSF